jgi:hypothetical protein
MSVPHVEKPVIEVLNIPITTLDELLGTGGGILHGVRDIDFNRRSFFIKRRGTLGCRFRLYEHYRQ